MERTTSTTKFTPTFLQNLSRSSPHTKSAHEHDADSIKKSDGAHDNAGHESQQSSRSLEGFYLRNLFSFRQFRGLGDDVNGDITHFDDRNKLPEKAQEQPSDSPKVQANDENTNSGVIHNMPQTEVDDIENRGNKKCCGCFC